MPGIFHPATLLLLCANAVPLFGVWYWHWDAALLLILYWLESAVIGFWTILAIAISPQRAIGKTAEQTTRLFLIPFFTVHAGIFMSAHFLILWDEFAGPWPARVSGPGEFLPLVVIQTGLWIPLAALFVSRGAAVLWSILPALPGRLARLRGEDSPIGDESPFARGRVLYGFYARVLAMQIALLAGGALALGLGAFAPLVFLVMLKTAIDLGLFLRIDAPQWKGSGPQSP